jgi:hypothetical protein
VATNYSDKTEVYYDEVIRLHFDKGYGEDWRGGHTKYLPVNSKQGKSRYIYKTGQLFSETRHSNSQPKSGNYTPVYEAMGCHGN